MSRRESKRTGIDEASVPFRAIADATYDWESWVGLDGRLLWVNPAVERITGHGVAEALGMEGYPLPIVLPEDRPKIEEMLQGARSGSSGNDVEFRVLRKDGGIRWAAISWQPIGDDEGRSLGFRTSVRDIQERKRAEQRLHEALAVAEQAAASRQAFLANTSHELRTPLQCILGYAQLLATGEKNAEKNRKIELIVQQTEMLLEIVSNVLEMAALQVRAPEIVEEVFDLHEKARNVVEAVRPLTTDKPVELRLEIGEDVPRRVRGDRLRVRQVLTNLVANAIKFTERGTVDLRVGRTSRGRIRFVVEDTGIGIAKSDLDKLFTPFARAEDGVRRGHGGTGLGLSIARALTDAMGGEIRVRSRPGKGSRFSVELPLPAVASPASRAPIRRRPRRGNNRLKVLVVDDSPAGRELVCEMLEGLGAQVASAATGKAAVERVALDRPDLIVMDLQMPGLDGAATAQLIRAQTPPDARRPRIVALTANTFGRAVALGSSGGMDGFLVKPARIADLRALLDRVGDEVEIESAPAGGAGAPLVGSEDTLDPAVVRDLGSAHTRDGRSLLEIASLRVLEDTPDCLRQIEAALRRRQLPPAASLAHRIKGNCLIVGAAATAEWAQRLDDALTRDDPKAARVQLRGLERSCERLERMLRPLITRPTGADRREEARLDSGSAAVSPAAAPAAAPSPRRSPRRSRR
jgi:PAS domain S-box-containing protein